MSLTTENKIITVFGPTSSGKTRLSLQISKYIWGKTKIESEFISTDSRQIYKELNVASSKVSDKLQEKFKHYFIDKLPPDKQYNHDNFKKDATEIMKSIWKRGRLPILVGGTGTFVMDIVGDQHLKKAEPGDLEYQSLMLIPEFERGSLYSKIETSVEKMYEKGLYDEIKNLVDKYNGFPLQMEKTLGYREFYEYCKKGNKDIKELDSRDLGRIKWKIQTNTKDYARRQINWLKKLENYTIVKNFDQIKALLMQFVEK